jgi:hypothetical protein
MRRRKVFRMTAMTCSYSEDTADSMSLISCTEVHPLSFSGYTGDRLWELWMSESEEEEYSESSE